MSQGISRMSSPRVNNFWIICIFFSIAAIYFLFTVIRTPLHKPFIVSFERVGNLAEVSPKRISSVTSFLSWNRWRNHWAYWQNCFDVWVRWEYAIYDGSDQNVNPMSSLRSARQKSFSMQFNRSKPLFINNVIVFGAPHRCATYDLQPNPIPLPYKYHIVPFQN
jgi:hypothetical protein